MTGEELRETMRRFPAPVAVVTTELDAERFGLTVGSLVSLSLTPPLVGISIGKDSSSHEPIRRAEGWAASLLAADQTAIAQHFARSGIPPVTLWIGVDVREGTRGPLVEGALAWLECRTISEHDAGDHTIFVGEVEATEMGKDGRGLVYRGGEYHPA
jgi:flavin reductase (DIM6/NTAB) family NADH-FMN oxidoreductase RutF